jgi:hypothetical protein
VDAAEVIGELTRLFERRDWRGVRALYHPRARVLTVMGGDTPLTADEVVAGLERASADWVYSVKGSDAQPLDEHAAIVGGRMRRHVASGGWEDASHTWLLTVRDDLIYRQGVYHDVGEAEQAYARLGPSLGISDLPES